MAVGELGGGPGVQVQIEEPCQRSYRVLVSAGSAQELHSFLREYGSLDRTHADRPHARADGRRVPCQSPAVPVTSSSRL